ncbi:M-phase inducer phosphatase-like [Saccoglossus kowalevskii]|uniref:M-phase inducer phosphatase n=1 Tax=Saccoglossus kowalevskii TaxID=10224 RepID=A0ABM0GQ97_SACKO|nr:PREDICTED: M-phase inducer phosphatase 2-like [Saccoglossus kowalevskii]
MATQSTARGSLSLPLDSNEMYSPCFVSRASSFSPMTDLALNLSGLSTSMDATPKRRLSLSNLDLSSTPQRPSSLSSDAGCCLDSPSPIESPAIQMSFDQPCFSFATMLSADNECNQADQNENSNGSSSSGFQSDSENSNDGENFPCVINRKKLVIKRPSAFKRINSMPVSLTSASRQCNKDIQFINSAIPFEKTLFQEKENFSMARPSSKVGLSTHDDFKFVEPLPPRKPLGNGSNNYSGSTPPKKRPISAPATLFNFGSPVSLSKSTLTSTEDDDDDGFLELLDTEALESNPMEISGMSNLLSAPIHTDQGSDSIDGCCDLPLNLATKFTDTPTLGSRTKRGLFRSPSVPCAMSRTKNSMHRSSSFLKRPERPVDMHSPIQSKRKCSVASPSVFDKFTTRAEPSCKLNRSKSIANTAHIDRALMVGGDQQNLIGDFSKAFSLPLTKSNHQDLKSISSETMRDVLNNKYDIDYKIIDCRYPYEYNGGHIQGAKNIYTKDAIMEEFLKPGNCKRNESGKPQVLIFHCEFSSERAPKLYRFLRNKDRDANKDNYPALNYPELYLLHKGYKEFYETQKEFCDPKNYVIMLHKDHANDLRHFRLKSRSWAGERSRTTGLSSRFKNF